MQLRLPGSSPKPASWGVTRVSWSLGLEKGSEKMHRLWKECERSRQSGSALPEMLQRVRESSRAGSEPWAPGMILNVRAS